MSSDVARIAYRQIEVNGSNSLKLVVMLYDGAIRFLGDAKACLENRDLRGKTTAINRALAILGELQSTLRIEQGGEIAKSLDRLYTYITGKLLEANANNDPKGINEAIRLLHILNSAWTKIAGKTEQVDTTLTAASAAIPDSSGKLEFFG